MEPIRVFIDGLSGTTGLKIRERLARHPGVHIETISPERRRDPDARRALLNAADVVFLCLPDAVATESAAMVESPTTCVIDASTAHRTHADWAYGLPELPGQRARIVGAKRISVPGCHATAFILAVRPLIDAGILLPGAPICAHSITGYSGGGRELIEKYEAPGRDIAYETSRPYALGLSHKHLPEMTLHAGLTTPPVFHPILGDFYQGMTVVLPLHPAMLAARASVDDLVAVYQKAYAGERFVRAARLEDEHTEQGRFSPIALNGTNDCELFVSGANGRLSVLSRIDNLGKGSSGAAIQCMNLAMGCDEGESL